MKTKLILTLAGSALTVLALAGCSTPTSSSAPTPASPSASVSPAPAASADAATASTTLGKIVVDGKGMTAYVFSKDTVNSGASACTGACATLWPAITSTSATPTVTGITGTVGTITGVAGGKQITINGLPIYTFAKDKAPGDTNGQGVLNVWYVLSPAGQKITTPAAK
ncbi:MAG: COG4315 family predicted lipoprotein [Lacisediminihabitans sp.]